MKKFLVIGNPIDHSLSPKLHNFWIKKNNLDAIYGKLEVFKSDLTELCENLKQNRIDGLNVTVPFKKDIIPHINILSGHALRTKSVNTISVENGNLIGHNTDIDGFELSIKKLNYDLTNKSVIILGAGGVVPSIIYSLKRMKTSKIFVSNRTKKKAEELKDLFSDLQIINWGELVNFDMIINATSLGLKKQDEFDQNFSQFGKNKFFYDVIYDPYKTNFFHVGNEKSNVYENGLNMFLYQAQKAFNIWHNIEPDINEEVIEFLKN
jgi:shikimate dehydrogenase